MKLAYSPVRGPGKQRQHNAPTLKPGTVNRNGQEVVARTGMPSTSMDGQTIYRLRCQRAGCGHEYGSNGTDAHLRKCPRCQGGQPGEPLPERAPMLFLLLCALLLWPGAARAQQPGTPGRFDFYLLNVVPGSEFCSIADVSSRCVAPGLPWVLHGLWPQYANGSYPVFCGKRPGPAHPGRDLDMTPDSALLQHEWDKHGTCTTLRPEAFFALARRSFDRLQIPPELAAPGARMRAPEIVAAFARVNHGAPAASFNLWCKEGRLTSVSECLSRSGEPIVCQGLSSCTETGPLTAGH